MSMMSTALRERPPEAPRSIARRAVADPRRLGRRAPAAQGLSLRRLSRLGQVALGLIWLIDGILQFQPYMFGKAFITGVILPSAAGQPGIIASPITWIANLIEPHVAVFNAFAATLQVLIGVGLLCRRTVKPVLLASFVWALSIWFSGEGFGMIFTGAANPLTGAPGAALVYILVGVMCWPRVRAARRRNSRPAATLGLIGERGARLAWAALWLGSAVLWLQPANDSSGAVHDAIVAVPSGAGWLTSVLDAAASATAGHGTSIAVAMAAVSAVIGIAVLRDWHANAFLVLAIAISFAYWVVGQGFGGIFTGHATDLSTAPLVILIASMLLALRPSARRRTATRPSRREHLLASAH